MEWILLIVVFAVIIVLKAILYKGVDKKSSVQYHYKAEASFMTLTENTFFHVLQTAVGEKYQIFAQVHLSTIINHAIPGQNWKAAFRHINEKSVDFVLCEKESLRPLLAIELNDASHNEDKRKVRDEEVTRIFNEAGIPLTVFIVQKEYSVENIKTIIEKEISL